MSGDLTLSIFTIEADRNPVLAVQFRKHAEAEALLTDGPLLNQLGIVRSAGVPLLDNSSILRVRLAHENERTLYFEHAASLLTSDGQLAVLLVKLDDPS